MSSKRRRRAENETERSYRVCSINLAAAHQGSTDQNPSPACVDHGCMSKERQKVCRKLELKVEQRGAAEGDGGRQASDGDILGRVDVGLDSVLALYMVSIGLSSELNKYSKGDVQEGSQRAARPSW